MDEMSEYDQAMPHVQEHLQKYQRALEIVRATHRGHAVEEVREALLKACAVEGVNISADAADDAARLISDGK